VVCLSGRRLLTMDRASWGGVGVSDPPPAPRHRRSRCNASLERRPGVFAHSGLPVSGGSGRSDREGG
jgi:hypothetical protein